MIEDATDGETIDGNEGNWTGEDNTDGETSDHEDEYCPAKETETDSEESYDEAGNGIEEEGKEKKENKAMWNTGKKRMRKEKVKDNKETKIERKSNKKPCPVPHCDAKIVHLPKHLRNVHKWTTESSRVALTRFKLHKKYQFVSHNVVKDKELRNNSESECFFFNSPGLNWKDEEDESSASPAEHYVTEISSLETTNTSQNSNMGNAGHATKILKQCVTGLCPLMANKRTRKQQPNKFHY